MKKIQIAKKKFKRLIKFGLPKKLENFVKIFSTLFIKLAAVNVNRKRWDPPVALGGRFGRKQPHFESTREPNHWLTLSAFAKQNRRRWDSPYRAGSYASVLTSPPTRKPYYGLLSFLHFVRRRWDSNPRNTFVFTRFPSVLHRPLGHSSRKNDRAYRQWPQTLNLDSARQSTIEALRSVRGHPSPSGKGDEEDRLGEVAASPNSKSEAIGGSTRLPQF
jgi:hypothetical protein